MREPDFARQFAKRQFVIGKPISVHQCDRDRTVTLVKGRLQSSARVVQIERRDDFTLRINAFLYLDDVGIEQLRQFDVQIKKVGAVLVSDPQ